MTLLVVGLMLWAGIHFVPVLMSGLRTRIIDRIGMVAWRFLFAGAVFSSLLLIILGWRSTTPQFLWFPPLYLRHVTMALVPLAVIIFSARFLPTDLKKLFNRPHLIAVKLWAVAHLLSNGELRSVILFGGFLAWAVLQNIFAKRKYGKTSIQVNYGLLKTGLSTLAGILIAVALFFLHPYFAGVRLV